MFLTLVLLLVLDELKCRIVKCQYVPGRVPRRILRKKLIITLS